VILPPLVFPDYRHVDINYHVLDGSAVREMAHVGDRTVDNISRQS